TSAPKSCSNPFWDATGVKPARACSMSDTMQWPAGWPLGPLLAIGVLVASIVLLCACEAALLNINRYRLRNLVRVGNRSARRTELLLAQSDRLTTTLLLCRVLSNVTAAALTAAVALRSGGTPLLVSAIALLALVILIFAEMAARTCGALYPEKLALP